MWDWKRLQWALSFALQDLGKNVELGQLAVKTEQSLCSHSAKPPCGIAAQAAHTAAACGSRRRRFGQFTGLDPGHLASVRIRESHGYLPCTSPALQDESERLPKT
jgi:hypothetical protein